MYRRKRIFTQQSKFASAWYPDTHQGVSHTCQIPRRGKNLMVFPPILWSYGGGCRSHGFRKKSNIFNFQYIWFILECCGRKQADFMGGYDPSRLTRLRINTFSSVIFICKVIFWSYRKNIKYHNIFFSPPQKKTNIFFWQRLNITKWAF